MIVDLYSYAQTLVKVSFLSKVTDIVDFYWCACVCAHARAHDMCKLVLVDYLFSTNASHLKTENNYYN